MTLSTEIASLRTATKKLHSTAERAVTRANYAAGLLDRLLLAVPGPDSKGYKLAEILHIAEEWQNAPKQ
jgi:hypothetical protein